MKSKPKIVILCFLALFTFFFSNDFGLIDIEKTSIVTAIALDLDDQGKYIVTAQIAVPEATDTNTENQKATISGKGTTVGAAIKQLGNDSGWFPKLGFCNLIIIGKSLKNTNVIKVLDYFAKTLRVQDSALVAMTDEDASKILETPSPLDNISSFALQKILLKTPGFDRDVHPVDIKTFCAGHYSKSGSAMMPYIKIVPATEGGEQGQSQGQSGSSSETGMQSGSSSSSGSNEKKLFDAKSTALFKNGYMVGLLDEDLTLTLNALFLSYGGTAIEVNDLTFNNQKCNYLLTVIRANPCIKLQVENGNVKVNISVDLFCKVADQNVDGSNEALSENLPLSPELCRAAEKILHDGINGLVQTEKMTRCDFLKINQRLYRYHYEQYSLIKDDFYDNLTCDINVKISGQL